MHKFATLLSSSALIFGMATASLAADLPSKAAPMPVVAPFSWTGFYLGLNAGCGMKKESASSAFSNDDPTDTDFLGFSFNHSNAGGCFGGVQGGYNYQFSGSPFVIGIEGDWQGGRFHQDGSVGEGELGGAPELLAAYNSNLNEFATVRGRLGYSLPSPTITWLLYATGGWAWGRNEVSGITDLNNNVLAPVALSQSQNISGWTAGGGIEAALNRNWSVKVEYLYLDFGSHSYNGFPIRDDLGIPAPLTLSTKVQTFKFGVNYRFGDWWVR